MKLFKAIYWLTYPNGIGAFLETMAKSRDRPGKKSSQGPLEEIALGIAKLIRRGFPPDYAMKLSPRQMYAWLDLNDRLDAFERAADLLIVATGAQTDGDNINKTMKEMTERWR